MTDLMARVSNLSPEKQSILVFRMRALVFSFRDQEPPLIPLRDGLGDAPSPSEPGQPAVPSLDQLPLSGSRIEVDAPLSAQDLAEMSDDKVARLLATLLPETMAGGPDSSPRVPIMDETIDLEALSPDQLDQLPDEQITRLLQDLAVREGTTSERIEELIAKDPVGEFADLSDERVDELLIQMLSGASAPSLTDRERRAIEKKPESHDATSLSDDAIKALLTQLVLEKGENALRALLEEAVGQALGMGNDDRRAEAFWGNGDKIRFKRGKAHE